MKFLATIGAMAFALALTIATPHALADGIEVGGADWRGGVCSAGEYGIPGLNNGTRACVAGNMNDLPVGNFANRWNTNDELNKLDDKIDNTNNRIDGFNRRFDTFQSVTNGDIREVESEIDSFGSSISSLQENVDINNRQIQTFTGQIDRIDAEFSDVNDERRATNDRLTEVNSRLDTVGTSLESKADRSYVVSEDTKLRNEIIVINSQVAENHRTISRNHNTLFSYVERGIGELAGITHDLGVRDDEIASEALQRDINVFSAVIEYGDKGDRVIVERIDRESEEIHVLLGKQNQDTLENSADIKANTSGLATVNGRVDVNEDRIEGNSNLIGANSVAIGSNSDAISQNSAQIGVNAIITQKNNGKINANKFGINANTAAIGNHALHLAKTRALARANSARLDNHDTRLSNLESRVQVLEDQVLELHMQDVVANQAMIPPRLNFNQTLGFAINGGGYSSDLGNAQALGFSTTYAPADSFSLDAGYALGVNALDNHFRASATFAW